MCEVLDMIEAEGIAKGMAKGKAEGMAEGMVKGKAEGKAEGMAEGMVKGENKEKMRTIKRMIGKYSNEDISYISGLSVSEIENIIKNIAPSV